MDGSRAERTLGGGLLPACGLTAGWHGGRGNEAPVQKALV